MGGLGAIITIIIIVAWIVKGLSSAVGNEGANEKKRRHRSVEEWDEMQAQPRQEMSEQQRALSDMRSEASTPDPSQMTMAERIELARQRARQQSGGMQQEDAQAEALRRARARAEQQAQQQRQAAKQQQRADQERAARKKAARERERVQQQRRRAAEEKARQEQLERQRRRRSRSSRPKQPQPPKATTGSRRESVVAESQKRIHKGHEQSMPKAAKRAPALSTTGAAGVLGSMDRASLRKAFIMKELLDKPVALRDPQADLPS